MPPVQSSQYATGATLGALPPAMLACSPALTSTRPPFDVTTARPRATYTATSELDTRIESPASAAETVGSPILWTWLPRSDGGASSQASPCSRVILTCPITIFDSLRKKTDEPSERRTSARAPLPVASSDPARNAVPEITVGQALPSLTVTSP